MALSQEMEDQLLKMPWKPLQIENCSFLSKIFFSDSGYAFLICDLTGMWYEEADANIIQERSKELNKRLKAPISSFLAHLSNLMSTLLESKSNGPSCFSCRKTEEAMFLHVKSQLSGLPFYWDFHCREASVSMVFRHFLCPLMSMTEALELQVHKLSLLLGRKDAEIQEYQESGAVLSRGRLKTEVFDEMSFHESFLTENLKDPSNSKTIMCFSDRLQMLYKAVTTLPVRDSPGGSGLSENPPANEPVIEDSATRREEPLPTQESAVDVSQNISQAPPSTASLLTQRITKPQKKKAKGLFK
ncbi:non-homologous end-joining factor 1 [Bombina bombina]|uniref:non-homologous end-joining factor 1 n=1 Tax=Bombina bombina TaxID=8345 RepID=UPI00235AF02C|nr:non-homologous end-joining factor 1 [Bombina bombina]